MGIGVICVRRDTTPMRWLKKIGKGIHSYAKKIAWFCWDEERKGFYETEKPEWAGGWCNFALG